MISPADQAHMAQALRLAKRGLYSTSPNPRVGCVIVRDGVVVGEGWHQRAGEAHAEAAFLGGRAEQALVQLNTLKKRDDLDYYARARIDARIAAITPTVLELRRQGVRDEDLRRR